MADFNEAPAVGYTYIKSKKGFQWSITMRADKVSDLINQIEKMEEIFEGKNWTPVELKGFSNKKEKEYVEGKVCPKCGGRIVIKTKSDGAKYFKCENGKYNPTTKQNFGCDFVDWNNMPVKYDSKNPYSQGNSISIGEYEDYPKQ